MTIPNKPTDPSAQALVDAIQKSKAMNTPQASPSAQGLSGAPPAANLPPQGLKLHISSTPPPFPPAQGLPGVPPAASKTSEQIEQEFFARTAQAGIPAQKTDDTAFLNAIKAQTMKGGN